MTPKNMKPEKIRELIKSTEFNQASIARDLKVSESLVSRVIDGTNTSDRVRSHIALCVCLPVESIWPETYLVKADPCKPGRPKTNGLYSTAA